jgi:hypothetical protein
MLRALRFSGSEQGYSYWLAYAASALYAEPFGNKPQLSILETPKPL